LKKTEKTVCALHAAHKDKTQPPCLNLAYSMVDTSALLRFEILGCCSQCYSFCWLIHVNVLLVAIEHCNECYLALLWFSHRKHSGWLCINCQINASHMNITICSLYSCLDIVYARGAKLIWCRGPYLGA